MKTRDALPKRRLFGTCINMIILFAMFMASTAHASSDAFSASQGMQLGATADDQANNGQANIVQLNETAAEMYEAVQQEDWLEALRKTELLSKQLASVPWMDRTTIEGAEAYVHAVVQLKQLLVAVSPDAAAIKRAAIQVRLASDALQFQTEPLWRQQRQQFEQALDRLEQAIQAGNLATIEREFTQLRARVELIRPSLLLSFQPAEVSRLQSLLVAFDNKLAERHTEAKQYEPIMKPLRLTILGLFGHQAQSADVQLMPMPSSSNLQSLLMSAFIVFVLLLAAVRKYRHDQGYVSISQRKKDDDHSRRW